MPSRCVPASLIRVHLRLSLTQLRQTLGGFEQRFVFLAEAETHLLRASFRAAVEGGARHAGDADFAYEVASELHIGFEAEAGDVRHDVVGAVWTEGAKARPFEHGQQQIAPRGVIPP